MYLLFHILFHYDLSQDIEYGSTVLYSTILYSPNRLYSRTLLFIQSIYNILHLLVTTSQSILPTPLGNLSLLSISVNLLEKDSSIMLRKVILTPGFYKGFFHMSFQWFYNFIFFYIGLFNQFETCFYKLGKIRQTLLFSSWIANCPAPLLLTNLKYSVHRSSNWDCIIFISPWRGLIIL